MNPVNIIRKYYKTDSKQYKILVQHGKDVSKKALEIAKSASHLKPDLAFIKEAAMLHDIGIFLTNAPEFGCTGKYSYIYHGYLGRKILDESGLLKHGLVCERHVGVGITKEDIKLNNLKLPLRDMVPVSVEEKIICFADKFFSKSANHISIEKTIEEITENIKQYGQKQADRFQLLIEFFQPKWFR